MSPRMAAAAASLGLILAGCGGGGGGKKKNKKNPPPTGTTTITENDGALEIQTWNDYTESDGILEVEIEIGEEHTAFMVTGESARYVGLERLKDPNGDVVLRWQDWWDSEFSLTDAFFGYERTTAFNWPIRDVDAGLIPGTYIAEINTTNNNGAYIGNEAVTVSVHKKADPDFQGGDVELHIIWADGVQDDADVVSAVEGAVERWREIWGAVGISLNETFHDSSLDPSLGFTYTGDAAIASQTEDFGEDAMVLIVGEQILDETDTFGISAGIPGTLAASEMTFVVVSWLTHAGADAAFSDEEIQIMGETMAHECGHYAGLYHPVEFGFEYWDALDDTSQCGGYNGCENQLGDNLMFPYPVCDYYGNGGCVAQENLTGQQQSVMNRYMGVL